jgi:hypothetical protein
MAANNPLYGQRVLVDYEYLGEAEFAIATLLEVSGDSVLLADRIGPDRITIIPGVLMVRPWAYITPHNDEVYAAAKRILEGATNGSK